MDTNKHLLYCVCTFNSNCYCTALHCRPTNNELNKDRKKGSTLMFTTTAIPPPPPNETIIISLLLCSAVCLVCLWWPQSKSFTGGTNSLFIDRGWHLTNGEGEEGEKGRWREGTYTILNLEYVLNVSSILKRAVMEAEWNETRNLGKITARLLQTILLDKMNKTHISEAVHCPP